MEGCDSALISRLLQVSRADVRRLLKNESTQLELTKSLLNLLHNIVIVGSVPVSPIQKAFFDAHSNLVLLLTSKSKSLKWKKTKLEKNIALVLNIAAACPIAAGS
jgi:hypothetical protein